ncbi:hypothetical protein WCLP8_1360002 [uncultured Gammaproteobacteria bacterium]
MVAGRVPFSEGGQYSDLIQRPLEGLETGRVSEPQRRFTATISGHSVRFFASPLSGPDFPWHSFDDLAAACDLDQNQREHFLRMAKRDHPNSTRVIATNAGLVTISPHPHLTWCRPRCRGGWVGFSG